MGKAKIIRNAKTTITNMLNDGATYEEIGKVCGVSYQRICQLVAVYNINNPRVRSYWATQPIQHQWLWRVLRARVKDTKLRSSIFSKMKTKLPTTCPVFGIQLDYQIGRSRGRGPNSASIDRINSTRGYELNNICIISWRANFLKNNGTRLEHEQIALYMRRYGL